MFFYINNILFRALLFHFQDQFESLPVLEFLIGNSAHFGKPPCALMDALGANEVSRLLQPILERFELRAPGALDRVGGLS